MSGHFKAIKDIVWPNKYPAPVKTNRFN